MALDVILDEDQIQNRHDQGPKNLSLLRRFARNLLRANQARGSLSLKSKRAGWRDEFLLAIMA